MATHITLTPEDKARLAWIASRLGVSQRELLSLGVVWWIRQLQGMISTERFTRGDLYHLQRMFPEASLKETGMTTKAFEKFCQKYWGRGDLEGEARTELQSILRLETIPEWMVIYAIWG